MSQNATQNAETAEENAERKEKKKEREEEEEEMEISSSRPRPRQIQAGDIGRTRRSRSWREPRSLRDCLWVFFFFFFLLWWTRWCCPCGFFFVFFLNVNRVSKTRFPCRRHLEKVPRKRWTAHENRALKTRFRSPKSSLWDSSC